MAVAAIFLEDLLSPSLADLIPNFIRYHFIAHSSKKGPNPPITLQAIDFTTFFLSSNNEAK